MSAKNGTIPHHPMSPYSPEQVLTIKHWYQVLSVMSTVGSLFVVISYLISAKKRKFPQRLTLYFATTSFGLSAALVIPQVIGYDKLQTGEGACTAQAVLIQWTGTSAICWWFCIVLNLYQMIVREQFLNTDVFAATEKRYVAFSTLMPAMLTIAPWASDKFGSLGFWCWIQGVDNGAWEFAFLYCIMGVLLIFGVFFWVLVMVKMKKITDVDAITFGRQLFFVFIFFSVFFYMFAHRLWQQIDPGHPVFALDLGHAIALSSIGLDGFLVFGTTREVFTSWKELITGKKYEQLGVN